MKKIDWNWKAFLLCPFWSLSHGLYFGFWIVFIPAIFWVGLVLLSIVMPLFILLLLAANIYYMSLADYFSNLLFDCFKIDRFGDITYVRCSTGSIINYLFCSVWMGLFGNKMLRVKNSQTKNIKTEINFRKQSLTEKLILTSLTLITLKIKRYFIFYTNVATRNLIRILLSIPLALIVNHVNVLIMSNIVVIMP